MNKYDKRRKEYARLVLKKGVNLAPKQKLQIDCFATNYSMAQAIAIEAYQLGASYVNISVKDNFIARQRLDSNEDINELKYTLHATQSLTLEQAANDWALISIDGTAELDVLEGVDSQKLAVLTREIRENRFPLTKRLSSDKQPWCVIACPSDEWARKILGSEAMEEDLWQVLLPILRLDTPNPEQAWDEHVQTLKQRCETLNKQSLRGLRFKDKESDLFIGLSQEARWKGGASVLSNGRPFIPNLPTEEVYTLPDRWQTHGYVTVKKPVNVLGTLVEGIYLRFEKGRVVEFSASKNYDVLKQFIETDEGAAYLGEVALVDHRSPVYQSKQLFFSILYDENASSHIALGNAYPSCLSEKALTSGKDLQKEYGCNPSLVHTDFMIGGDETVVIGVLGSGEEITLMEQGKFI